MLPVSAKVKYRLVSLYLSCVLVEVWGTLDSGHFCRTGRIDTAAMTPFYEDAHFSSGRTLLTKDSISLNIAHLQNVSERLRSIMQTFLRHKS